MIRSPIACRAMCPHTVRRLTLVLAAAAWMASPVDGVRAASDAPSPRAAAARRTPAAAHASRADTLSPRSVPRARATASKRRAAGARTLDPILIAGELDVPEVLFITAHDQRRAVEFHHARYLPGSLEFARSIPLPSSVVVDSAATPARARGAR